MVGSTINVRVGSIISLFSWLTDKRIFQIGVSFFYAGPTDSHRYYVTCVLSLYEISTNLFFFFFWMSTNLFALLFGSPGRFFLRSFWLFLSITFLLFTPPLVPFSYAILWFSPFSLLWSTKFNVCSLFTNQTKSI